MTSVRSEEGQRRLRRVVTPAIAVALLVAVGGTWFAMQGSNAKAVEKPAAPVTLQLSPADVTLVERKELARVIPLSGSLQPLLQSTVKSKVSGEVQKVFVREGERVSQGQVLAQIDTADIKARLDSQIAALEEARAKWQIAAKNRDNNLALLKQNFISQNAFDTTESTYKASEASVRSAEAQVRLARNALEDAMVHSPLAGIVARKMVNAGEKVAPDSPLLSIVDLAQMEIEAPVPASEVPRVRVGQVASFRVDGFGERTFVGRVERINPVTEQGSRSITLYLSVPNAEGLLKGGMFAKGDLVLDKTEPMPAVPMSAIREEAGQTYVFTLEGGKLARRAVTLGLRDEQSGLVEVRSGLTAGVQVINAKLDGLKPDTPAAVQGATAPARNS
jgi:RND family efflux transporter MFP subunit